MQIAKQQIGIQLKIEKNVMNGLCMYVVLEAHIKVCKIECKLQLAEYWLNTVSSRG